MSNGSITEIRNFRSNIAQSMFYVEGQKLSLEQYPMFLAVYDGNYNKLLLKTGRQVAKSTTIACFMLADSIGQSHFKTFYISPSQEQTRKFSHTRVAKIMSYSPDVRTNFLGPDSIDNVFMRLLRNGSEMAFTYALDDPDRARGYSADRCCFDEIQDILYEPVVPVIEECMANSPHAYSIYCGTPKTMENTIEYLWGLSSQTEWCIKCHGCGKSTFIDSMKSLGKRGPECLSCRKPLDVRNGRWVDMKAKAPIKGFHIPQPILPANVPASWQPGQEEYTKAHERWDRMLLKMETYGDSKFSNEVLGVSTATGVRLLTKEILERLCGTGQEEYEMTRLPTSQKTFNGIVRVVAGVDWSGGGGEVKGMEGLLKSRTVLSIFGQLTDGRLKLLYYKIFPNGHAAGWIDEIVELCNAWKVHMLVGDAGEGALANSLLRDKLGHHRCTQVRYLAASKPIDWNPGTQAFHTDRTTAIDNFALFLTQQKMLCPNVKTMQPAFEDILNVYEETTMAGRKVWRHAATQPDDCLHSFLFSWMAWKISCGDLKFYA